MIGIYSIMNKQNKKYYIGQSVDIFHRFSQHKCELNKNEHVNKHLQYSWNKYGQDNFEFKIVEECQKEKLNERERYWITQYDSYNNGYNLDLGGDGILGYKHNEDTIAKMRKIQNPLPVLQFDKNFNLV